MFRMIKTGNKKELSELSLKQREMFFQYQRDRVNREWPPLVPQTPANSPSPRLQSLRPTAIVLPTPRFTAEG